MSVDPLTIGRLAFIRYLHQLGVEQSRLPVPQSSASILLLHDAVESFLLLAAERLGAPSQREFEKYWPALNPYLGGATLGGQQGMRRLNRARNELKHNGQYPPVATIEQAVADTAAFMTANAQPVFGVDYDEISMADVISQGPVRDLVRQAEAANAGGGHPSGNGAARRRLRRALRGPHAEDVRRLPRAIVAVRLRAATHQDDG